MSRADRKLKQKKKITNFDHLFHTSFPCGEWRSFSKKKTISYVFFFDQPKKNIHLNKKFGFFGVNKSINLMNQLKPTRKRLRVVMRLRKILENFYDKILISFFLKSSQCFPLILLSASFNKISNAFWKLCDVQTSPTIKNSLS